MDKKTLSIISILGISLFIFISFIILINFISAPIGGSCINNLMSRECGSSGSKSLEVFGDRFYNGSEYVLIDNQIIVSTDPVFDFMVEQGIYQVYFKDNPIQGRVVKYVRDTTEITFQPMALNYRNDLNQLQQITMVNSVTGSPNQNNFLYANAYGTGIDLSYKYLPISLKEELIINSRSNLANPQQFILNGGNPTLDLDFIISGNSRIIINGIEWNQVTSVETSEEVLIQDINGNVLYKLAKPFAFDSNGESELLTYNFRRQGNSLFVIVSTSYDWLNDPSRVYPVLIDPSLIVPADVTLGGDQSYTYVRVDAGGTITINDTFGWLNITADLNISIYGTIDGDDKGENGGKGRATQGTGAKGNGTGGGPGGQGSTSTAAGGSGGAHGGYGGNGGGNGPGGRGSVYRNTNSREFNGTDQGSGGGAGGANSDGSPATKSGGDGGGALRLKSPIITINGTITLDGENGKDFGVGADGAGGGGSGGHLFIEGNTINISSATINLKGGNGGNDHTHHGAGGGGGGGVFKVFYGTFENTSTIVNVSFGKFVDDQVTPVAEDGADGVTFYERTIDITTTLVSPSNDSSVPENQDFVCNTTISIGDTILSNITWHLYNSTGSINTTLTTNISGTSNQTTFSHTFLEDVTYTWNCLATDNESNTAFANSNFTIHSSSVSPAINLNTPTDNQFFGSENNINFSYTPTDLNGIDYCMLYGNWSGSWIINQTDLTITNDTVNSFSLVNIPESNGNIWNVQCNDTTGNMNFANSNFTFNIDTTNPVIDDITITTTAGSQTFTFGFNASDTNLDSCWYSIFNSTGDIDLTTENTSVTCNSLGNSETVSAFATYNFTGYTNDSAGNNNSLTLEFTTSTSVSSVVSGGGSITIGGLTLTKAQNFTITNINLGNVMDISLAKESTKPRKKEFMLRNIGLDPIELTVVCDTQGVNESSQGIDICDYVELPKGIITVSPNLEDPTILEFKIQTPENAKLDDEYFFNLIAVNSGESKFDKLSVRTSVSFFALFFKWSYFPFQEDKPEGEKVSYPIALVSIIISILLFAVSIFMFSRFKLINIGFLFSTLIFFLSFILLLIVL